jgi:hypothetical protein
MRKFHVNLKRDHSMNMRSGNDACLESHKDSKSSCTRKAPQLAENSPCMIGTASRQSLQVFDFVGIFRQ